MKNKHIVTHTGIPDGVACIPEIPSNELVTLSNLTNIANVITDNSCVPPEYVNEHKLEASVIVGIETATKLGIDTDGDQVQVCQVFNNGKHIVACAKYNIPEDTACIPKMSTGETVMIHNIGSSYQVVIDNGCVPPEFVKDNNLDDSIIVGIDVANKLGIDMDPGGDVVLVQRAEQTKTVTENK